MTFDDLARDYSSIYHGEPSTRPRMTQPPPRRLVSVETDRRICFNIKAISVFPAAVAQWRVGDDDGTAATSPCRDKQDEIRREMKL